MIKIYQTKFGKEGNCFPACLASILEIPIEGIPNFQSENGEWYFNYKKWFRRRGLDLLALNGNSWPKDMIGYCPQVYAIVSGKTPRGLDHATVYLGGNLVHDPYLGGGGIENIIDWIYIVPVHPKLTKEVVDEQAGAERV